MNALTIPSPGFSGFHVGPLVIHLYSLCILAGIAVGWWLGMRRWVARGGRPETLERVLVCAVVCGIVGARIYHVVTDHQLYFGPGRNPVDALKIWNGGLGIWGAVALGAVGAWLAGRRDGVRFWALADTLAPGILLAQAVGRLGNWFNQELYGRPLQAWWALEIDPAHRVAGYEAFSTYHPTFAYEMVWNTAGALLLLALDRRLALGRGKLFWAYVAVYTSGRAWIEHLRIDKVNTVGGVRLNEYTSWIMLTTSLVVLVWLLARRPGRDGVVQQGGSVPGVLTGQNGSTAPHDNEESHDAGDDRADDQRS